MSTAYALQKLLFETLRADASLDAFISGRVYDRVPADSQGNVTAIFPYVAFGAYDFMPDDSDCIVAGEQGNVPIYATVAGIGTLEIPAGINAIRVNGRDALGDGGNALYVEGDNPDVPALLKATDALGRPFINRGAHVRPQHAGGKGSGLLADAAANLAAFNAVLNSPEHLWVQVPAGHYKMDGVITRAAMGGRGIVLDMHPDATLDFSNSPAIATNHHLQFMGQRGASVSLTSDVAVGATTIPVTSVVGLAKGMKIRLASRFVFDPNRDGISIAELCTIEAISGSSVIVFEPITMAYNVADSAYIEPITPSGKIRLVGGRLVGNPAVVAAGLMVEFGDSPKCEGTEFVDWRSRALSWRDCFDPIDDHIKVYGSEVPDTGYGVCWWNATRGGISRDGTFLRTRHAFSTNGSSGPTGGIVQDCTGLRGECHGSRGSSASPLDTHSCSNNIRFHYNKVFDAAGAGANLECPNVELIGNEFWRSTLQAIIYHNEAGVDGIFTARKNKSYGSGNRGIYATSATTSGGTAVAKEINLEANEIYGAGNTGVDIRSLVAGRRMANVRAKGNLVDGYAGLAYNIQECQGFNLEGNDSKNPSTTTAGAIAVVNSSRGFISGGRLEVADAGSSSKVAINLTASSASATADIDISGVQATTPSGAAANGTGVKADNNCVNITVRRDNTIRGFNTPVSLGTGTGHFDEWTRSAPSSARPPVPATALGHCIRDTTLNKPIFRKSTGWEDANGTDV